MWSQIQQHSLNAMMGAFGDDDLDPVANGNVNDLGPRSVSHVHVRGRGQQQQSVTVRTALSELQILQQQQSPVRG